MTLQDPIVGRVVDGRYLVESRIARGGMATVYLALDRRLDREVALKVMHEHLAVDEEFVSRFVREARAAARLSHPNVVQVFDQGSDGPVLYLTMEYLPGRTLRDVLTERGALTPRESVSVLESVLGALAAAHRAGIVHRDVKPENVILTDDGRIKVADFGLARAISAPISATGNDLLGTVAYLAPELVSRGIADARADVYGAGIMLFELLTGKQPFTGADPLQVAYRHVHESVPEPSSISPQLPVAFDPVVLEATHHDPDRRQPDAGALLADLHAAAARVPAGGLDVRAADAATLRLDADRTELIGATGAPAAASGAQPTRALAAPRRESRAGGAARATTAPAARPGAPLVPRLKVHDDEPAPPGFLGDRRRQGVAAITGALVLVLVIFGGIWWFTGGPGAYIHAPSLVGERVTDAQRILATNGLGNKVKSVFSTKVASGQVISTDPGGGENVKKNGVVTLTVSKGPQLFAVPDVVGLTTADAKDKIKNSSLTVDTTIKKDFSPTVPKGKVISTSPEAKTKIAPDREVTLTVSKGPEPVLLDNVVGQQVDAAKALLKNKGFEVKVQLQPFVNGSGNPGTVVAQDPAVQTEGQTASVGSTITLTVIDQPQLLNVPDVRGHSFDDAVQILNNAGFQHIRREGNQFFGDTVRDQNVFGQQPADTQIVLKTRF